ncbi:CD1871A family CXXC motif-containing protein [Terrisporobacter petrolearius]
MFCTKTEKTRWLILVISVMFIGLGIYRGEADAIFSKAVNICMECIGIG